ncbi:MAG: DUF4962 domain-containing protein [Bacteroidaceae bacterium]
MKKHYTHSLLRAAALCLLAAAGACSDKGPETPDPDPTAPTEAESTYPEAWHNKIRQLPYPRSTHEVYLNPVPFIVPQALKTGSLLAFELSQDSTFQTGVTSKTDVPSCLFNPHRRLEAGRWFWRYRSYNSGETGTWSKPYAFEMKDETPVFVTPEASTYLQNLPRRHPRLYCFLDDEMEAARTKVASHREYKQLLSRAKSAVNADYAAMDLYAEGENLRKYTGYLYTAYHLTQEAKYLDRMHDILKQLLAKPVDDGRLFGDNFAATDYVTAFIDCYDMLYDQLSATERTQTEDVLLRFVRYYFARNIGYEENHIFNNHFWQRNMRAYVQAALLLHDKQNLAAEMRGVLEYYYELWASRAPDTGFNLSGIWRNGVYYFNANAKTLWYMPTLYGYLTGGDFLAHPWYQNAGKGLVYSWPPQSQSLGFGDGRERETQQGRQRIAFAYFLAQELGDPYAGWYADRCRSILEQDYENRLYRMVRTDAFGTALPADAGKLAWYEEAGEVDIHTDLAHLANDMAFAFRSSPYASGSHTLADQNGFRLLYKGEDLFISSGYYQNFADAHNLLSYRHSRAHNTILVNGIGQPFDMKGYGNITRAIDGEHISYCLGDASHAYSGISEDPMWVDNFRKAGVVQSTANGFGPTPLTRYRRHVAVLHPRIVVIYDELEASEAATWDWLLHSHVAFALDEANGYCSIDRPDKGIAATVRLYSRQPFRLTQTDRFFRAPSNSDPEKYPNQWHLTAAFDASTGNRIVAILQACDTPAGEQSVRADGNTFEIGTWRIEAELDPNNPACLHIADTASGSELLFEDGKPTVLQEAGSTTSVDDQWPKATRAKRR